MTLKIKLPESPKVEAREKSVVICFSNGNEMFWGDEQTEEEAQRIARELEVELRVVKYVKWHVQNFIRDMLAYLESLSIDATLLDSILIDGHTFARESLDKKTVDSIIMGSKQGLRKQVLKKLDADKFIV